MNCLNRLSCLVMVAALICGCSDSDKESNEAVCNPDAVPSTRTAIDDTNCVNINLSNPNSASSNVVIEQESGELIIKLKTDSSICLSLSGAYDGGVRIKNSNNVDVDLILNGITITSNSSPGYLKLNSGNENWGNTYLVKLVGNSSITGASSEESKKVLSAEPNLSFIGEGTLNITAKYKTGIGCDDVLTVYSGNINITLDRAEAAKTSGYGEKGFGIKAVNGFVQKGGSINISANDNISNYESRGIKVDGSDATVCHTGKGYIHIEDGTLNITADAKALTAGWEASEDAATSNTSDDPQPDVVISGGKLTLTTTGTPRENNTNSLSPEGIEGKHNVTISGGEIIVNTTDDGIQAGNMLEISGGKVYAHATKNDALDGNQSVLISGGKTFALGTSAPEGGLDADNNRNVNYTGGLLVAIGGDNNAPQGSNTTKSFVQTSLGTGSSSGNPGGPGGGMGGSSELAGVTLALAADGNTDVIAAVSVPSSYIGGTNVLILADSITSGASYNLYTNPEITPDTAFWFNDALLVDNAMLSGGTVNAVTAGTATGGGNPGGPGGGNPGGPGDPGGPGGDRPDIPGQ